MNCPETFCLTAPEFRPVYTTESFQIRIGYERGRPFAVILIDRRDGTHLHLPATDVMPSLRLRA